MNSLLLSGEFLAVYTNIAFALGFVLAHKIDNEATPIFQNAVRSILGVIVFSVICLISGTFLLMFTFSWQLWLILAGSITFMVILGDTASLQSQKRIGPVKTLAITTTTPFFTIIFATIFFNRQISLQIIFSAIFIGLGVIIITYKKSIKKSNKDVYNENEIKLKIDTKNSVNGMLLAIFAATSWAIGVILTDYSMNEVNVILNIGLLSTIVALMLRYIFASIILSLTAYKVQKKNFQQISKQSWKILLLSGVFSTIFGAILFAEAARTAGASILSIISTALPLFTIPFSYLINKEKISKRGLLGVILTIIGVLLVLF